MTSRPSSACRVCPACESPEAVSVGHISGFDMLACQACGTLFTSRIPTTSEAEDYDAYYSPTNLVTPGFIASRLEEIVRSLGVERRTGRWLDVGFGAGTLMQAAARAGWRVTGTEVSHTACEHVAALGFEVVEGVLKDDSFPPDAFDVISASEVIEHVPDPAQLLRDIRRFLRPGGVLWATTPHGRGLSARLLGSRWSVISPPEHLQLFSVRGMRNLLHRTGFPRTEIATHGTNPVEIYHVLRGDRHKTSSDAHFNRVESSYALNAALSSSFLSRAVKSSLNGTLNVLRMGDSLKIRAQ